MEINIQGDDRENVTLRAEESDDYTKLTNVDGRDLFIMKQGIGNDNKFLPHIGVYNHFISIKFYEPFTDIFF